VLSTITAKSVKVKLDGIGPFDDGTEVELRSITIFTGKNATGKSFLLRLLYALALSAPTIVPGLVDVFIASEPMQKATDLINALKLAAEGEVDNLCKILTELTLNFLNKLFANFGSLFLAIGYTVLCRYPTAWVQALVRSSPLVDIIVRRDRDRGSIELIVEHEGAESKVVIELGKKEERVSLKECNVYILSENAHSLVENYLTKNVNVVKVREGKYLLEYRPILTCLGSEDYVITEENCIAQFARLISGLATELLGVSFPILGAGPGNVVLIPDTRVTFWPHDISEFYAYSRVGKAAHTVHNMMLLCRYSETWDTQLSKRPECVLIELLREVLQELGLTDVYPQVVRLGQDLYMWDAWLSYRPGLAETDVANAPSGSRALIGPLLLLTALERTPPLVFIDEPEIHLHPAAIRKFARVITLIIAYRHALALRHGITSIGPLFMTFATHSEFLLCQLNNELLRLRLLRLCIDKSPNNVQACIEDTLLTLTELSEKERNIITEILSTIAETKFDPSTLMVAYEFTYRDDRRRVIVEKLPITDTGVYDDIVFAYEAEKLIQEHYKLLQLLSKLGEESTETGSEA